MTRAACVDVGSTYTKAAVVDLDSGALLATAGHPTTSSTDVLHGLDAAVDACGVEVDVTYVCSSAGGGLRLAVVGYEALVSAEAGRRVALSAGARVVHVAAGRLSGAGVRELRASRPDVVLLVGGTDGGDADTLLHNAARLAAARWRRPVVLAGNADARTAASAALRDVPHVTCDNVLPRVGDLRPGPARAAIRDVFLRHVIGGKGLSRGRRFASLVRAATPDAVLTGVELLADTAHPGGLLVIDVGGATTDVYSVLPPTGSDPEVAGTAWRGRTVEGDLGVRWSARGVVEAARADRLAVDPAVEAAAAASTADPGRPADPATDLPLATLAATLAARRHARGEQTGDGVRRGGRDLRDVSLVIGSGGVLRHTTPEAATALLEAVVTDHAGAWPVPRAPRLVIDTSYVLAPAGLLAKDHRKAAETLLMAHLTDLPS